MNVGSRSRAGEREDGVEAGREGRREGRRAGWRWGRCFLYHDVLKKGGREGIFL